MDACLAAAIMAWVAEPFFASLGGGGFVAIATPEGRTEVIDGNDAMPAHPPEQPGQGIQEVYVPDYGDGTRMGIGGGSVAVPGVLASVRAAWERHGHIEWAALFENAISAARKGIPFPKTSSYYLSVTFDYIWSRYDATRALYTSDDRPLREGEHFVQGELADTLEAIATEGSESFYRGTLGERISRAVQADGGFMRTADLESYTAEVRDPIATEAFGWQISCNPPPAVGGVVLAHMLALLEGAGLGDPVERLRAIVRAQEAAVNYRKENYQDPSDIASAWAEALAGLPRRSPSTTHSSVADADGYVCALSESNGYGSGLMVNGILLNNSLGEEELNPLGVHRLQPGTRCHSNMAPTIARGHDATASGGAERVVGLGSPGADRIVGAIAQTLIRLAVDGDTLADAVRGPRAHLDHRPQGPTLCFEGGLPGAELDYVPRPYDDIHMYFGAVQVASVSSDGTIDAAHDPRRSGGSVLI